MCPSCAASIPVVGFNAVLTSEHFGAFFTFAVLHAALAIRYIKVGTFLDSATFCAYEAHRHMSKPGCCWQSDC
jgi:hypothetical protein